MSHELTVPIGSYFAETFQGVAEGRGIPTPAQFVGAEPIDPSDEPGFGSRSEEARARRACALKLEQVCRDEVKAGLAVASHASPGAFVEVPMPPSCPTGSRT